MVAVPPPPPAAPLLQVVPPSHLTGSTRTIEGMFSVHSEVKLLRVPGDETFAEEETVVDLFGAIFINCLCNCDALTIMPSKWKYFSSLFNIHSISNLFTDS